MLKRLWKDLKSYKSPSLRNLKILLRYTIKENYLITWI